MMIRCASMLRVSSLVLGCLALAACGPSDGGNDNHPDAGLPDAGDDAGGNQNDASPPLDTDGDGVPDADDPCPTDPDQWTDADGDGHCDEVDDDCPDDPGGWVDTDGDGRCDGPADACPTDPDQWTDADGDGHCDEVDDDCPGDPDGYRDTNADGACDGLDDNDGDGIPNGEETVWGEDCARSDPDVADTDGDGIHDNEDPYPQDPFAEYILVPNDLGTIDLMLSNRDGTFTAPFEIGEPNGCTAATPDNCTNPAYRYVSFVIADFDGDGSMDFLAVGSANPADAGALRQLWWFWRSKDITSGSATLFQQRLVEADLDRGLFGTTADLDNDDLIDLTALEIVKPANITEARLFSYTNTGLVGSANCAYTTDVANPEGCAFVQRLALDLTSLANGLWVVAVARDAVDVDGDGLRDLVMYTMANGGNVDLPVYVLAGNGDGTFAAPGTPLFSHNSGACGASPANSILFGDYNDDGVGDVIIGLDDDGDAGSAWFYPGQIVGAQFSFDFSSCAEAFDINPAVEDGADDPGVSSSARSFDFDFDGHDDVMLGWNPVSTWAAPSQIVLLRGNGTGTFQAPSTIRDFPTTLYGNSFALPHRLCQRFQILYP